MQTIPDAVMVKILKRYPHFTTAAENLAIKPHLAIQIEREIASNFLRGDGGECSALELWHLASCAAGKPYGADVVWIDVSTAASESGYSEQHIRRLIYDHKLPGEQRKGIWWVRRDDIAARERDPRGRPRATPPSSSPSSRSHGQ